MIDNNNKGPEDSSDIILEKNNKELKIRDIDDFMAEDNLFGAG